jgi:hypothetical protein
VLHQIGVGALGPVFRTYEPEGDRLVAVKAFRLDITPEQAQALADELSKAAGAGLFHPSIVEPIGAGVEGTMAYAAEEYVAAESLDVAMRDYAPAPLSVALPLITQLAGAIDFARAAGVGHGALHPRDIFVTPEDVRATGFGVVEALERIGLRAPVRRPYSAPERIDGAAWSTPADVFSLAAITFELLTARRPAGLGAEIGPLTAGTPNSWQDALHAVLARAMDEDPGTRPQTALALASALEAAARGDFAAAGVAAAADPAPAAAGGDWPERGPDAEQDGAPAGEALAAASMDGREEADELTLREQEAADVASERDDDEAHHRLMLEEMNEPATAPDAGSDPYGREDVDVEADADRFLVAAAGTAAGAAGADEFREAEEISDWPRQHADEGAEEPARWTLHPSDGSPIRLAFGREDEHPDPAGLPPGNERFWHDHAGADEPVPQAPRWPSRGEGEGFTARRTDAYVAAEYDSPSADRRPTWILALLMLAGLLGGLGVGYALWGRSTVPGGEAGAGGAPAAAEAGEAAQPMGAPAEGAPPGTAAQPATNAGASATPAEAPVSDSDPATAAPAAAAAPSAARGRLIVRSTPSNAGVTVDGTWRGRTPLTLDDLPLARYQVRVVEQGYTAVDESVTLSAGTPERTLAVRLRQQAQPAARGTQPAARGTTAPRGAAPAARGTQQPPAARPDETFVGSVYVDSRPRGAAVSINGKPVGVTPLRIPEMPIGTHVVRLELPDHRIWSSTARVTAGQEARVTGSLEPIQPIR